MLAPTADRGFTATEYTRPGGLTVPLGLIDKPFEQPLLHTVHGFGYQLSEKADGNA